MGRDTARDWYPMTEEADPKTREERVSTRIETATSEHLQIALLTYISYFKLDIV